MAHKLLTAVTIALALATPARSGEAITNPLTESATWDDLKFDVLGDAAVGPAMGVMSVEAPYRAHDAATVPIRLRQDENGSRITAATVVVDENPAPVAAVFAFGEGMGPLDFELRVRVDQYSNVRVIAQTEDGLHMTGRYVKASGGCSAPAAKDAELALQDMGRMKIKTFDTANMSTPRREAQIMIRHPNYSGLQRDQITQLFIPAHFIDHIEVWQGEDMLFTMAGGISISENPVFRFQYDDNGATQLTVKATDTEGNTFESALPKSPTG